jgi:stage II sporulation protein M
VWVGLLVDWKARCALALACIVIGGVYPVAHEAMFGPVVPARTSRFQPQPCQCGPVFLRNATVATVAVGGGVTGGVITGAAALNVGFSIGASAARANRIGMPWPTILAALIPHVLFEIPAMVAACAAGLIGSAIVASLGVGRRVPWRALCIQGAVCYAGALVLLVVAATVECRITPILLSMVVG